jgi:predicted nucleotidyltransferase
MVMNLKELKKNINPILQRFGVKKAGIFGSYVRGEAR